MAWSVKKDSDEYTKLITELSEYMQEKEREKEVDISWRLFERLIKVERLGPVDAIIVLLRTAAIFAGLSLKKDVSLEDATTQLLACWAEEVDHMLGHHAQGHYASLRKEIKDEYGITIGDDT